MTPHKNALCSKAKLNKEEVQILNRKKVDVPVRCRKVVSNHV